MEHKISFLTLFSLSCIVVEIGKSEIGLGVCVCVCVCVAGGRGVELSEEQRICILTPPAFFSYLIPWQLHLYPLGKRWESPVWESWPLDMVFTQLFKAQRTVNSPALCMEALGRHFPREERA